MKAYMLFTAVCIVSTACAPPFQGLAESEVVCSGCTEDELAVNAVGIRKAAQAVIDYTGYDLLPDEPPITVHMTADEECSKELADELGGTAYTTPGKICLLYPEDVLRAPWACAECEPDTPENHSVMTHEGLHRWFHGRVEDNNFLQEGFAQYVDTHASGLIDYIMEDEQTGPITACYIFQESYPSLYGGLMTDLCTLGITPAHVQDIVRAIGDTVDETGIAITNDAFEDIVSETMGVDTRPAFQEANLVD